MTLEYNQALRMARWMKAKNDEITLAILDVQKANYGVVALRFSDEGRQMEIEILNEPFDPNVRVYPG
jgi:hypothetical protein